MLVMPSVVIPSVIMPSGAIENSPLFQTNLAPLEMSRLLIGIRTESTSSGKLRKVMEVHPSPPMWSSARNATGGGVMKPLSSSSLTLRTLKLTRAEVKLGYKTWGRSYKTFLE
jgi:hypothetical protein